MTLSKIEAMLKEWRQALRLGLIVKPLSEESGVLPYKHGPLPPAKIKTNN